jgi:hypothetical protein
MNTIEEIEKAFKAGAEFIKENTVEADGYGIWESIEFPTDSELDRAATSYINNRTLVGANDL